MSFAPRHTQTSTTGPATALIPSVVCGGAGLVPAEIRR